MHDVSFDGQDDRSDHRESRASIVESAAAREMEQWYRWGWVPLVAGCGLISALVFSCWQLASERLAPTDLAGALQLSLVRDVTTSVLLAVWAGAFVFRSRRRIQAMQKTLRAQEAALTERSFRAEQLAGVGALSRIVAHEIRSPINGLVLHCHALERLAARLSDASAAPLREIVGDVGKDAERLERIASEYLAYTRNTAAVLTSERVDLTEVAKRAIEMARRHANGRTITLTAPDPPPVIRADAAALRHLFDALLRHAIIVAPPDGAVRVSVGADEHGATIQLTLEGTRFDRPEALFRPFYAAPLGESGLALAIARDTVRAHGGDIGAFNHADTSAAHIAVRLPGGEAT